MLEESIKLTRTRGLRVDPCNADGRLLQATVQRHVEGPFQPDTRQAAVLEHTKFIKRKEERLQQTQRCREQIIARLQSCSLAQQSNTAAKTQQAAEQQAHREQLAAFNKSVTVRNQTLSRRPQPLLQENVVPEIPRLARSAAKRSNLGQTTKLHTTTSPPTNLGTESLAMAEGQQRTAGSRSQLARRSHHARNSYQKPFDNHAIQTSLRSATAACSCSAAGAGPAAFKVTPRRRKPVLSQKPAKTIGQVALTSAEDKRLQSSSTRLANLAWKVKELRVRLPQLCMCHQISPLDPEYPFFCASNCPLYRNPEAHETMLKSLLQAYNLA